MKRNFVRFSALFLSILLVLPFGTIAASADDGWDNPYSDVSEQIWSYSYIRTLHQRGILPDSQVLNRTQAENRANFVSYLYGLHLALGGEPARECALPFADVPAGHPHRAAICWAYESGVVKGVNSTAFAPDANLTREQICTIVIRFARLREVKLEQKAVSEQFMDSLKISTYARSSVAACQMAGIITGYSNNWFRPAWNITREECITVLCRLLEAAENPPMAAAALVSTADGTYDGLYSGYSAFDPVVPAGEAVELDYFAETAFIGDSVSLRLQYYCAATKALGDATFLCAGSLSATNALWNVSDASVHPSYQGKKMLLEDGVAASGVNKVYIMLGINNIRYGIGRSTDDMVKMVDRILDRSPKVQIIIQSVTPMASTSNILSSTLNNEKIIEYNEKMKSICEERGWYYVDVAEVMRDENGALISTYCSDNSTMGIHFTTAAAQVWVEYLKTHVPDTLRG